MLRVTDDILELKKWAEARAGRPCRHPASGQLEIAFPGEPCLGVEVGWEEFEPIFCLGRSVFVYDDGCESRQHFIGSEADAREYFARQAGPAAPGAHPGARGNHSS